MSKSKRLVQPYVDKAGQTIQPGDRVVVITHSTGTVRAKVGEYVGVIPSTYWDYNAKENKVWYSVQVRVPVTSGRMRNVAGDLLTWNQYYKLPKPDQKNWEWVRVEEFRITTLQNNLIFKVA